MQSETVTRINEAILAAQAQMKPVKKDRNNPFYDSKYADLPAVWESLAPFRMHGLTIVQMPVASEPHTVSIETRMTHTSGEWYASVLTLPLAKSDPQGVGSALTYGRRYGLACMTGQVTEEDDDGNAASQPQSKPAAVPTARAANAKKMQALQTPKKGATSDAAPPLDWEAFLDYAGDDPDRMNVITQLKEALAIGMVSDLQGEARVSFVREFQQSCKDTGVPCEEWVKA
jgi:hypothetical protein